jgi:hypothetical protein
VWPRTHWLVSISLTVLLFDLYAENCNLTDQAAHVDSRCVRRWALSTRLQPGCPYFKDCRYDRRIRGETVMRLFGAVVLIALAVFPGLVFDRVNDGRAGSAIVSLALLGVAVLILVASVRGDLTRWCRVASSGVATGTTLLWVIWSGLMSLRWSGGA